MTTYFTFAPSTTAPYSFSPTLDGAVYSATVPWLLFGPRYYLNLAALDGTQIIFTAIAGSPTGVALVSLSWANGSATATTVAPHGYRPLSTVSLTLSGSVPNSYNGLFSCLITGPTSFAFPLAANPGMATVLGTASFDVNLIGGVPDVNGNYFSSTLVYRTQSGQFEISP